MPLTYVDSSALVKRYVPEIGSTWVAQLCQQEPIAGSLLSVPEITSALARRTREGALTGQQRDVLLQAFFRDLQSLLIVRVDRVIVTRAATLLLTAPLPVRLRTLDALHVALAQALFEEAGRQGIETGSFIAADRALLDAARWVGLPTLNPDDYP